jgi:hypothetical protein
MAREKDNRYEESECAECGSKVVCRKGIEKPLCYGCKMKRNREQAKQRYREAHGLLHI